MFGRDAMHGVSTCIDKNIIAPTIVGAVFVSLSAAPADRLLTLYKSNPFSHEKAGFFMPKTRITLTL